MNSRTYSNVILPLLSELPIMISYLSHDRLFLRDPVFETLKFNKTTIMHNVQNTNKASCHTPLSEFFKVYYIKHSKYMNIRGS